MQYDAQPYSRADELLRQIPAPGGGTAYDSILGTIERFHMPIGYWLPTSWVQGLTRAFVEQATGWGAGVRSRLQSTASSRSNAKAVDLRNSRWKVDIELERGNVASFYRCLIKMMAHRGYVDIDVGVIVAGTKEMASALGENITYYERAKQELDACDACGVLSNLPLLLIGLKPYRSDTGVSLLYGPSSELLHKVKALRQDYPSLNSGEREEKRKQLQVDFEKTARKDPLIRPYLRGR